MYKKINVFLYNLCKHVTHVPNDLFILIDYMPTFLDTFMPHCNKAGQGVMVSYWCIIASRIFCPAAMAKVNNLEGVIV